MRIGWSVHCVNIVSFLVFFKANFMPFKILMDDAIFLRFYVK